VGGGECVFLVGMAFITARYHGDGVEMRSGSHYLLESRELKAHLEVTMLVK